MTSYQKSLIRHILIVAVVTLAAMGAMINFKDWVNRSEAIGAMEYLGQEILDYRERNFSLPSEFTLEKMKETLPGGVRIGDLQYRGIWINYDAVDDEILAYSEKTYKSLVVKSGYVVLRLGGRVEWMSKEQFGKLLHQQQSPKEFKMLEEQLEQRL